MKNSSKNLKKAKMRHQKVSVMISGKYYPKLTQMKIYINLLGILVIKHQICQTYCMKIVTKNL